ncbi:MAG: hypothetical protein K2H87_01095 [Duncaniella sp.]|nr:hypothetical protein [Duncaniella sp.]
MSRNVLAAVILTALPALVSHAAYPSMLLTTTDGTGHLIGADGLTITYSGANLNAANSAGATLTLPLGEMLSMEFSADESGLATPAVTSLRAPFVVYGLDGASLGSFDTLSDILTALPAGPCIVRDADSRSTKILIRK